MCFFPLEMQLSLLLQKSSKLKSEIMELSEKFFIIDNADMC